MKNDMIKILLIEDNPGDARLIKEYISDSKRHNYDCTYAESLQQARELLEQNLFNIILLDLGLPDSQGIDTFYSVQESSGATPTIILTGNDDEDLALEIVKSGAQDYLIKNNLDSYLLEKSIQYAIERKNNIVDLIKSEEKYRELFEKSDDAILIIRNNRFIDCNDAATRMLRFENNLSIIDKHPSEISPEIQSDGLNSYSKADEMMEQAFKKGSHRFEWEHKRADGEVFPVEVLLTSISIDKGNKVLHAVWRDITDRKIAEKNLVKLNRIYSIQSNINQAIVRIHDVQQLLKDTCLISIEEGGFHTAWIGTIKDKSPVIDNYASEGAASNLIEIVNYDQSGITICNTKVLEVLESGIQFISNDITNDSRLESDWKNNLVSLGIKSMVLLPIRSFGNIVGCFALFSDDIDSFDDVETGLLNEAANDISFALEFIKSENDRIKHEQLILLRSKLWELSISNDIQKLLTQSLKEVCGFVNSPIGFYHFVDNYQKNYSMQVWLTPTSSECYKAEAGVMNSQTDGAGDTFYLREREPLIYNDYVTLQKMKGLPEDQANLIREMIVPIIRNDKIVAVMGVGNKNTDYTNEDLETVRYMADVTWEIASAKRHEEELAKQARIITQSPVSIVVTDKNGDIEYINPRFTRVTGYEDHEVIGKNPRILKSGKQSRNFYKDLWGTILQGETWSGELQNKKKNGEIFWESVVISPVLNKNNEIVNFIAIKEDITEKKINEESLNLFRTLVDQTNDTIEILDPVSGKFINCNNKAYQSLGYTREEFLSMKVMDIDPTMTEGIFRQMVSEFEKSNSVIIESTHRKKDGTEFPVELNIKRVKLESEYLVVVGRDITKRNIERKELIQAKELAEQSNKLKDAFIANMSHEIRTPLNGILGLTDIIKESYSHLIKEEDKELFSGIDSSGKRIIRTVDMILNYSRMQVGEYSVDMQKTDIVEICENIILEYKSAAAYKSLQVTLENTCDNALIKSDSYSVTHAISNLVDNAVKYTNKGFIKIIIHKNNEDEILVSIQDSGIGIGEEYLKHIFEPYRQEQMGYGRAYEGVGLGLSLVKKLLEQINATLTVESKKNKGTTFTINFGKQIKNVKENQVDVNLSLTEEVFRNGNKRKVLLLVEDDEINQLAIKRGIEKYYKVFVEESAPGAMKILETNHVDLILMDISIKGELNGLEFTKKLKTLEKFKHIPIIVITAHASESDITNSVNAGCDDYLAKPFSIKELSYKIKKNIKNQKIPVSK